MSTPNEAEERLRGLLRLIPNLDDHLAAADDLTDALAAERQRTVDEIRERLIGSGAYHPEGWLSMVLDTVAGREADQ